MPSYAAKNYPAGRPQSRPGPRRPLRRHLWGRLIASSSEKTRAPLIRTSNELVVNGAKASPWAPPVAPRLRSPELLASDQLRELAELLTAAGGARTLIPLTRRAEFVPVRGRWPFRWAPLCRRVVRSG